MIKNIAPLETRKQVKSFICMINNYRDMSPKRSHLLAPLTNSAVETIVFDSSLYFSTGCCGGVLRSEGKLLLNWGVARSFGLFLFWLFHRWVVCRSILWSQELSFVLNWHCGSFFYFFSWSKTGACETLLLNDETLIAFYCRKLSPALNCCLLQKL